MREISNILMKAIVWALSNEEEKCRLWTLKRVTYETECELPSQTDTIASVSLKIFCTLQFDKKNNKSGISANFDPRDKIRIYLRSL